VTERRMVSDLYVFDLETFHWEKIQAFPEDDIPKPRYFHSADACECLVPVLPALLTPFQGTIN